MDDKVIQLPTKPDKDDAAPGDKPSAATRLVEIAQRSFRFGISHDGDTFAVPRKGARIVSTLRGGRVSLRGLLARQYFKEAGRAAPQQALADAMLVLEGEAQDKEPTDLWLRVAEHEGATWLDLGDNEGRCVRIAPDRWEVLDRPPVLFRRTALTGALPVPKRGGSLDALWPMLNVDPADRTLVAAWLVACLKTGIAHPILTLQGEQGTGKTTAERMLVSILDASPVPVRKPPRDPESWVTAAAGSWLVGIDNMSTVPDWLSDSICRAVTGDGDVRRKLYTDGEHHVYSFRRCVALNGIDLGALRGDLAERMLSIQLERIPDDRRLLDSELLPAFDKAHPEILGAVLDLAAGVAGVVSSVRLDSKPRMADFARIVAAVDEVLGSDGLTAYIGKQGAMAADALSGDPFIEALAERFPEGFHGTAAELYHDLKQDHAPRGWPASGRTVTSKLRRLAPVMRKAGWTVTDDGGANHDKTLRWSITPPARPEIARKPDPQYPRDPQDHPETDPTAGVAGVAGVENGPSQDEWGADL